MDIVGCPECPHGAVGDVRNLKPLIKDKQFGVAYVGHVLECLPGKDMEKALKELYRVADKVYVVHLPDESLSSRHLSEVKSVIHAAPPELEAAIDYTDLATGERRIVRA